MALMLPSTIMPDSPPGERELFRRFRDDPDTSTWVVLHSLDIANHRSQVAGEVDFVVVVPGKGVVCIEVKSHSRIRYAAGSWYYGTNPAPDPRGPFKQASEGMHSIRNNLLKYRPDFSRVVFWSAVIFPFASGSLLTGEWHSWQLIDRSRFLSAPISRLIISVIDSARAHLAEKKAPWFHRDSGEPYEEQCREIVKLLRPTFEFYESPSGRGKRISEELKYYTEEQLLAIDRMETNARVVYSGPAGTGKTLIATETARRAFNSGRKTLFLCYNNLLGRWLRQQTASMSPLVKTSTLHSFMVETAGIQLSLPQADDPSFWNVELPYRASEGLISAAGAADCLYDELIVDEAQDVITQEYLDFLDLALKGGLFAGRWRFFGDFEKQAIYRTRQMFFQEFIVSRASNAAQYALRENCRNLPRIAAYTNLLGGLDPPYRKVLRPDDGIEPLWQYYGSFPDQVDLVSKELASLLGQGIQLKDIVILSPKAESCATAMARNREWRNRLVPLEQRSGNVAGFCTVHAFKGLESPVIILTDIEKINTSERADIFYIGVTRSVHRLSIFVADSARKGIREILS